MSRGQKGNTMAKEWRIIVKEGDETKLDAVTSCLMLGVVTSKGSRVLCGSDAVVGKVAAMYLHMLEKITEQQEKYPELREAINALNALKGIIEGADDD